MFLSSLLNIYKEYPQKDPKNSTPGLGLMDPGMNRTWNDVDENSVGTFDFPAMMLSFLAMQLCDGA